jgi:hypothetical protein
MGDKIQEASGEQNKPLIIYYDDDDVQRKTYSNYELTDGIISFVTNQNKITIPISRLIKIKEDKEC